MNFGKILVSLWLYTAKKAEKQPNLALEHNFPEMCIYRKNMEIQLSLVGTISQNIEFGFDTPSSDPKIP